MTCSCLLPTPPLVVAQALVKTREAAAAREQESLTRQLQEARSASPEARAQMADDDEEHAEAGSTRAYAREPEGGDDTALQGVGRERECRRRAAPLLRFARSETGQQGCHETLQNPQQAKSHKEVQDSLLEEIELLMHERDVLLARLASHDAVSQERQDQLAAASSQEIQRLNIECDELRARLSATLAGPLFLLFLLLLLPSSSRPFLHAACV